MNQINLPTTGDRVLDTLLTYAIMDIGLKVDPNIRFEIMMGQEIFLKIQSTIPRKKLGENMLLKLKEESRGYLMANRLAFPLNVGSIKWHVDPSTCIYCVGRRGKKPCGFNGNCGARNIPTYAVFSKYVDRATKSFSFPWDPKPISKTPSKKERYATLYVGISPYWSRGLRKWNKGEYIKNSTSVIQPILPFACYGLANYAVSAETGDTVIQTMFSPPIGRTISHLEAIRLLALVRRIINIINLEMHEILQLSLPTIALPLSLLCLLDIPAIYMLHQTMPSILLINYNLIQGCPANPRGYEEFSLADILEFYKRLGEHFWSFKKMISDLINTARRKQYESQVFSILIEIALGIKNREPSYLNNALARIQSLKKEIKRIYILGGAEVLAVHKALRSLQHRTDM